MATQQAEVVGFKDLRLERRTLDGKLDYTFPVVTLDSGPFGCSVDPPGVRAVVEPGGKILLGGAFIAVNSVGRNSIARLNRDGTLDHGFDVGGGVLRRPTDGHVAPYQAGLGALVIGPTGHILVAGSFDWVNGVPSSGFVRLHGGELQQPYILPGSMRRPQDGTFEFQVIGPENRTVIVESAEKLDSQNWTTVATAVLGTTPTPVKDSATNAHTRFYRAVMK